MPKDIKDKSNNDLVKISCTSAKKTIFNNFLLKKNSIYFVYLVIIITDDQLWSLAVTEKLINHLLIL